MTHHAVAVLGMYAQFNPSDVLTEWDHIRISLEIEVRYEAVATFAADCWLLNTKTCREGYLGCCSQPDAHVAGLRIDLYTLELAGIQHNPMGAR
jgi:hypothetical protein